MDFSATAGLAEAEETVVAYDELTREASLTLPFDMGFSRDTEVPYTVTITE